jgi:hypothetical protein
MKIIKTAKYKESQISEREGKLDKTVQMLEDFNTLTVTQLLQILEDVSLFEHKDAVATAYHAAMKTAKDAHKSEYNWALDNSGIGPF